MNPALRLTALVVAFCTALTTSAKIGAVHQMVLGNPSSITTTDPNNHTNYLFQRDQYAMDYNDANGVPNWVSWNLTAGDIGSSGRSSFIVDTNLPTTYYWVQTTDYSGSGYDRGHMCPSGDRTITTADNQVVFYMSNIVPQAPDNNQGVWANFEAYCRTLAQGTDQPELLIICGPGGFNGARLPSNAAAIPGFVWKIVLVVPAGDTPVLSRISASTPVIAIEIPNTAGIRSDPWQKYIVRPSDIEAHTGLTFFKTLDPAVAAALRASRYGDTAAGAPVITLHPVAQTTYLGGPAAFSVTATSATPLSYQWYKDDQVVAGATNESLAFTSVQASDAGVYSVTVTNSAASVSSADAALVITGIPVSIVSQPVPNQTLVAGSTATLAVTATGSPTITYQWYQNGTEVTGARSATLVLPNVQADDAGDYTVVVDNLLATETSAPGRLSVSAAPPVITTTLVNKTANVGSTVSFAVTAIGSEPFTYRWLKNDADITGNASAATATLILPSVQPADAGSYKVIVGNAQGSATSNAVTLTVNVVPTLSRVNYTGGTYTQTFGQLPTATTALAGAPPYDLSAQLGASELTGWRVDANATLASLLASTGTSTTGAAYSFGSTAAPTDRALGSIASNSITPRTGLVLVNETGVTINTFTLTYTGEQWRNGGNTALQSLAVGFALGATDINTTVTDIPALKFTSPIASATAGALDGNAAANRRVLTAPVAVTWLPGQTLVIRWTDTNDSGNDHGLAIDDVSFSTEVTTPAVAPVVTSTSPADGSSNVPLNTTITVGFNQPVSLGQSWFSLTSRLNGPLAATVTGGPTTFTLTPPVNLAYTDEVTIRIIAAQITESAKGVLHLTDDVAWKFTTVSDTVQAPSVTVTPTTQTVTAGANVSFTASASGTPPLAYLWKKDGAEITGASTGTLTLNTVSAGSAGTYSVLVTNFAGSATASGTLVVNVPPAITTPPVAQTVVSGTDATFSVAATGTGTLAYQWRKSGTALVDGPLVAGSTSPVLTLRSVSLAETGTYDVVITNVAGSANPGAALTVTPAPAGAVLYSGGDYAQAFDGLPGTGTFGVSGTAPISAGATSRTPALLTGWSFARVSGDTTRFTVGTGSSTTGSVYSFGTASAPADRALGTLLSGSNGSVLGLALTNTSGTTLTRVQISYRGEQYRKGGSSTASVPDRIAFEYRVGASTVVDGPFVPLPALDFTSVVTGSGGGTVDGNANARELTASFTLNTPWSPGQTLVVRWRDVDISGSDDGLAVDDFTFTAMPPPPPVVVSSSPLDNAPGVPVNTPVTIGFDQPVVTSGPWVTLTGASGPIATAITGGPATFTVTGTFGYNELITVRVVGTLVADSTGTTRMSSDYVFAFRTALPPPPTVSSHPEAVAATVGDSVSFSVAASSATAMSFQWQKDGSDLASATSSTLILPSVVTADAGSYRCVVSNIGGSTTSNSANLTVRKATAAVTLGALSATYDGTPKRVTVTTIPAALDVIVTYDGGTAAPVNAGEYRIRAEVNDVNYEGFATGILAIAKASATITLTNLVQTYDGTPRHVEVATVPAGLTVDINYGGSPAEPVLPGMYPVDAHVRDVNYAGSTSGELRIVAAVLVRHAPTILGGLDGSVQLLAPEAMSLQGWISGDLLVPGTPALRLNGSPTFVGTKDATGSPVPAGYPITLTGAATLRYLVQHVDPIGLPAAVVPVAPAGTRTVVVTRNRPVSDFSGVRHLTINGDASAVALPPGSYGDVTLNGGAKLILGGTTADVAEYHLQNLELNGDVELEITGRVVVRLANSVSLGGVVGNAVHPDWLLLTTLGDFTVTASAVVHGTLEAPQGSVTVNGTVNGTVSCDQLAITGGGLVSQP